IQRTVGGDGAGMAIADGQLFPALLWQQSSRTAHRRALRARDLAPGVVTPAIQPRLGVDGTSKLATCCELCSADLGHAVLAFFREEPRMHLGLRGFGLTLGLQLFK